MVHIGYFVTNRRRTADFYEQVIGFARSGGFHVDPENMHDLTGLKCSAEVEVLEFGGVKIELIEVAGVLPAKAPGTAAGIHHLGIKRQDAGAVVERARAFGCSVRSTFRTDHMTHYIEDPEGNIVEISEVTG